MELKFFTLTLTFTLYLIICTVTTPGAAGAMVTSPGSQSSSIAMDGITHHGHAGRPSSVTNTPITNLPITPAATLAAAKPASSNQYKKPMLPPVNGFQQVRNMLKVYVCMYVVFVNLFIM
jgi:hypothetical protein